MTPETLAAAGLRYEVDGAVATITLDRPASRNSQTPTMWRTLAALGAEIPDDVRVVVLQGEGSTFSAGLDRNLLTPGGSNGGQVRHAGHPGRVPGRWVPVRRWSMPVRLHEGRRPHAGAAKALDGAEQD